MRRLWRTNPPSEAGAALALGLCAGRSPARAARPTVRPKTYTSYESIVRVHLKPGLGRLPLARLTPQQVQAVLNAKASTGLSPRTVAYIRAVLRQALAQAERWGLVSRNAARL